MNLLRDAWLVLQTDRLSVLLTVAWLLWGSILIAWIVIRFGRGAPSLAELFAVSLGGWMLPVFFSGILILALGVWARLRPSALLIGVLLFLTAAPSLDSILRWAEQRRPGAAGHLLALGTILLALAFLRLSFVSRLLLPMYFDSAEHYRIIRSLIQDYASAPAVLAWPVRGYYHLGYHVVLAVMTLLSQADLGRLMLVSGVFMVAALPIPLFVVASRETGSGLAGLAAVLLGSLGWYMPAHVLNWGKYPGLLGASVLLFALTSAYLASAAPRSSERRVFFVLSVISAFVTTVVHSRSIILFAVMLASWLLSTLWLRRPTSQRLVAFGLVVLLLIGEVVLLVGEPVLQIVLDPYLGSGIWITCIVGLLAPFAFIRYPRLAFSCLLCLAFLLLGLFIPGPDFASGPLLDRPLIEMVLFIPLALVGAAGSSALASWLGSQYAPARTLVVPLLAIVIVVNASARYSFYPSECCLQVGPDDLTALSWLAANPPAGGGRVLIPTAGVLAAPPPYPPLLPASDAGVWVEPLTRRQTASLPYPTDFASQATLDALCAQDVTDIFVGSSPQSFSDASLQERPSWYIIELSLPQAVLYRVAGCQR
jgi:hypothetical protein